MRLLQFLILLTIIIQGTTLVAQETIENPGNKKSQVVFKKGNLIPVNFNRTTGCDHDAQIMPALKQVDQIRERFFKTTSKSKFTPKFILPVKQAEGLSDPGFYSITAHFDHNAMYPDFLTDYNCGDLTYDTEDGYNHDGTDFFLWPYPWYKMNNDLVEIVAAASGTLVFKQDGYFDQQCEITNEPWNGVGVMHEDGSTSWYIHMKENSLTEKSVGDTIAAGEFLGIVGSSGNSLTPHLHFEVYNHEDIAIDPFMGPCNETITESWWFDQLPYKEAGINKISTNNTLPVFSECPGEEIQNESTVFFPGDTIWLLSYFRNVNTDDEVEVTIKDPDNNVSSSWSWNSPWTYYSASYLYFFIILENEKRGDWIYQVEYKGETYEHTFEFKEAQDINENKIINLSLHPNPVKDFISVAFENDDCRINQIKIFDCTGVEIRTLDFSVESTRNITIDMRNFSTGIYIVQIESNKGTLGRKIVRK